MENLVAAARKGTARKSRSAELDLRNNSEAPMPDKRIEPSIYSVSFSCPHCGAHAHQAWFITRLSPIENNATPFRPTAYDVQQLRSEAMNLAEEARRKNEGLANYAEVILQNELALSNFIPDKTASPELVNVSASRCYACDKFSLWIADRLVYPFLAMTAVAPNSDMKDEIQGDFKEAVRILDASPRGAAALLRLCIQKLCAQLGESGKNINEDIGSLVRKGLDPRVQKALDIVRVIGNEAVHPGQIDLRDDRDIALELAALVNLIADVMITQPKKIDAMFDQLPDAQRKAIERRDRK
jgi:hypothetical protein